jgi:hypothetical protein
MLSLSDFTFDAIFGHNLEESFYTSANFPQALQYSQNIVMICIVLCMSMFKLLFFISLTI